MAAKSINIIKGTDRQFNIRVVNKSSGDPVDLTGLSGSNISLKLPNEDETQLSLTVGSGLTVVSATGGKIQVNVTDTQSALLKAKDGQSMELTIINGSNTSKVQFLNMLNVKKGVFDA
jgi:hypothetical protein